MSSDGCIDVHLGDACTTVGCCENVFFFLASGMHNILQEDR